MGDSEEVIAFGKKLNMNAREQVKYKYHIQTIRINEIQCKKWKTMNYIWQFFFFGGLFIAAIVFMFQTISLYNIPYSDIALDISEQVNSYFGGPLYSMTVIAFPLMMWSGIVRSKWDGKLTRSTAYALSFLENIEHRQFLEGQRKR